LNSDVSNVDTGGQLRSTPTGMPVFVGVEVGVAGSIWIKPRPGPVVLPGNTGSELPSRNSSFVNYRETNLKNSLSRLRIKTYVSFVSVHNNPVAYT